MSKFDLEEIKTFLAYVRPENRQQLLAYIHSLQVHYGAKWLVEFKKLHPDVSLIADLIANYDALTAVNKLEEHYTAKAGKLESWYQRTAAEAALPLLVRQYRPLLYQFHTDLRAELDKKQF